MTLVEALPLVFQPGLLALLGTLAGVAGVVAVVLPASRKRMAAAGLLTAGAAAGLFGLAVLRAWGLPPESGACRAALGASWLLAALAAVDVGGILLFEGLLSALRLKVPALVRDLILAAGYLIAVFAVLSTEGVNLTGLIATSAVVTAVVAFSLQDTLGNVMGGMVLQLERSIEVGDVIRVGADEGIVREIRWRQTTLEAGPGNRIVIPNSALMKGTVTVLGHLKGQAPRRRQSVAFNVFYDAAPNEVIEAVEHAFRIDTPALVASSPAPVCFLMDFKDNHAVYHLRYWLTEPAMTDPTDSVVRARVYYALARAGIRMAVPSHAVVVMQRESEIREQSRAEENDRRFAALRGVDFFHGLTDEELALLARRLKPAPFARGEALTHQGAKAHWLYIVYRGEAEVRLRSEDGGSIQTVARLGPGDIVGEMGLLTGEPRTANVVAVSDVACYRLDREGFTSVLARRPEIAESISMALAKRRLELEVARGLNEEAQRARLRKEQSHLLSRIRQFFTLS